MVGSLNLTSKILFAILAFMMIFIVSGCGEDSKSCDSNISRNDAGYYGEDVYFGDHKILGKWRTNTTRQYYFNTDGTVVEEAGIYRTIFPQYGVSEDGSVLKIIDERNNTQYYTYLKSDANCFTAVKKSTQVEVRFCKDEALNFIDNSYQQSNEFGFFDYDTYFGYNSIVGRWAYILINSGVGGVFDFKEDGSGHKVEIAEIGVEYYVPFHYGVSQDGKELKLRMDDSATEEIYKLIGTLGDSCYKMVYRDIEYKLCKF